MLQELRLLLLPTHTSIPDSRVIAKATHKSNFNWLQLCYNKLKAWHTEKEKKKVLVLNPDFENSYHLEVIAYLLMLMKIRNM